MYFIEGIKQIIERKNFKMLTYLICSLIIGGFATYFLIHFLLIIFNIGNDLTISIVVPIILFIIMASPIGDVTGKLMIKIMSVKLNDNSHFNKIFQTVYNDFKQKNPDLKNNIKICSIIDNKDYQLTEFAGIGNSLGIFGEFVDELSDEYAEKLSAIFLSHLISKNFFLNMLVFSANVSLLFILLIIGTCRSFFSRFSNKFKFLKVANDIDNKFIYRLVIKWISFGFNIGVRQVDFENIALNIPDKYLDIIKEYCETGEFNVENKVKIYRQSEGMDEKVNRVNRNRNLIIFGAASSGILGFIFAFLGSYLLFIALAVSFFLILSKYEDNENYLYKLKYGDNGERRCLYALSRLSDGYDVITNAKITDGEQTKETDFIVVGPTGLYIIENKNYIGNIVGDTGDKQLIRRFKDGNISHIDNPCRQVSNQRKILIEQLFKKGIKMTVSVCVLFSNPNVNVCISNRNNYKTHIFTNTFELTDFIEKHTRNIPENKVKKLINNIIF